MNSPLKETLRSEAPSISHLPVMVKEALEFLNCRPGGKYVDATLGLGGHAAAILERSRPDGILVGMERDEESLERARSNLKKFKPRVLFCKENFKNLPLILNNLSFTELDGILVDLGISSFQLLSKERGFSFQQDSMLDMRMDRSQRLTAADLVNELPEDELRDMIRHFGEEPAASRIAAAIVRQRGEGPITRCLQLADLVKRCVRSRPGQHIHPATRTFLAFRIAVNQELEGLEPFFTDALPYLKPGGRILAISFHSLEDRIVKQTFRKLAGICVCDRPPELCTCPRTEVARVLTPKPVTPSPGEIEANVRSRSARLRAIERVR